MRRLGGPLLLTAFVFLVAVLVMGTTVNGARRWLPLGVIDFQPSELAKLALAVWLAAFLVRRGAPRSLGELAVSRAVKELVEAGLVDVGPSRSTAEVELDDVRAVGAPALRVVREDDEVGSGVEPAMAPGPTTDLLAASLHELAEAHPQPALPTGTAPAEDEETADVARRLSTLGPDGAAAVAAAADATTTEERDAALDAIDAEVPGQAVNRSALLKFLSTVRT